MSEFVNYNQRGVDLPHGCKDLVDVLQLSEPETGEALAGDDSGSLGDISGHMKRLLRPGSPTSSLLIFAGSHSLQLFCSENGLLEICLAIGKTQTSLGAAIKRFFEQRSISVADDAPSSFGLRMLRYPMPRHDEQATQIIVELFNGPFQLDENVHLEFFYSYLSSEATGPQIKF